MKLGGSIPSMAEFYVIYCITIIGSIISYIESLWSIWIVKLFATLILEKSWHESLKLELRSSSIYFYIKTLTNVQNTIVNVLSWWSLVLAFMNNQAVGKRILKHSYSETRYMKNIKFLFCIYFLFLGKLLFKI